MENPMAYGDLWHRSGMRLRVSFPLMRCEPGSPSHPDAAQDLIAQIDAYLAAGWSVREPGIEPGEEAEEVGYCLRTTVDGRSGPCPRIFFYSPNAAVEYQCGSVYLNTPEDVAEFEKQSGLRVQQMQEWPSGAAPKKGDRGAERFILKCQAFSIVRKANPKWSAEEEKAAKAAGKAYTVPKRIFVRYGGQTAKPENVQQNANNATGGANADDAIVNAFETEIENAGDLTLLANIGKDIAADHRISDGGKKYLRGVYDGRKKYLEAMTSTGDGIPW